MKCVISPSGAHRRARDTTELVGEALERTSRGIRICGGVALRLGRSKTVENR